MKNMIKKMTRRSLFKKVICGTVITGLCLSFNFPFVNENNVNRTSASDNTSEEAVVKAASSDNQTMLQGFESFTINNGKYWNELSSKAGYFAKMGITSIWLPPAYKGMSGTYSVGYDPYDLYDLGEFNQMGCVRTKYGTKNEYISAINKFHKNGIAVYADAVMNHKMGANEKEQVKAYMVDGYNRNRTVSGLKTIEAWTKYTFPGRNNKYSSFKWDYTCFDGVDWDQKTNKGGVYRFNGKAWDRTSTENGNYDYLMGSDIDLNSTKVRSELKKWGAWYTNFANLDGFRIDAVKHMEYSFVGDWIKSVRETTGKDVFAVSEYLDGNVNNFTQYIEETGGTTSLFDYPLYFKFKDISKNYNKSMQPLLEGTLVSKDASHAVTFVNNHDQQPGCTGDVMLKWFKPHAYTFIMTREEGTPCIFYSDYYGSGNGKNTTCKNELDSLMIARKYFAYGQQATVSSNGGTVLAWSRKGDAAHKNSGLASVISTNKEDKTITLNVGKAHAGEKWIDIMGNSNAVVTISSTGYGKFKAVAKKACVYVKGSAISGKLAIGKVTGVKKSEVKDTSAKLSWKAVTGAGGYRIYKYDAGTKKWKAIKDVTSTSTKLTGIKSASLNSYRVRAFMKVGGKYYFGTMSDTIKVCTKPGKVNASAKAGEEKVKLSWKKAGGGIAGYKIYYKTSPNGSYKLLHTMSPKATGKLVTGLKSGKTYYFRMRAYRYNGTKASDGIIYGAYSKVMKVTVK